MSKLESPCAERPIAHRATVLLTCGLVFLADVVTKAWARSHLAGKAAVLLPRLLNLTLTSNTGVAFGLGRDQGFLVTIIDLSIFVLMLVWAARNGDIAATRNPLRAVGIGCLLGGALGNLMDRLVRGRVTDFLEFAFVSFPVFNVADACIDIGVLVILITYMRNRT